MCTCEEIERGKQAFKASKLGPVEQLWTQDGKLGITIQDTPPESGRRTHLLYLLIRIAFCHVSANLPLVTRQCDTVQTSIVREHILVHVLMKSVRSLGIKCFGFSV